MYMNLLTVQHGLYVRYTIKSGMESQNMWLISLYIEHRKRWKSPALGMHKIHQSKETDCFTVIETSYFDDSGALKFWKLILPSVFRSIFDPSDVWWLRSWSQCNKFQYMRDLWAASELSRKHMNIIKRTIMPGGDLGPEQMGEKF